MNTASDAQLTLPGIVDPERFLDFLVIVTPPAAAVVSTVTTLANLWLAGRIVKHNGQLVRVDLPRLLERLDDARDHLLSNAGVIPKWILSRRD